MRQVLLFAALILAPSAAAAADEWDAKQTREIQARFGECVVKKNPTTARRFVLTPDMEPAPWRRAVALLGNGFCLNAASKTSGGLEMKLPGDTMRYALAEALVRLEFAAPPAPSITNAAPLEQPKFVASDFEPKPGKKMKEAQLEKLTESRLSRLGTIFLANFGECVVRDAAGQSLSLLMTEAGSLEESAILKSLMPQFGRCFPAGQQFAVNKTGLRGTVAMNYYRLAHAPRVAATPAGALR